MRALALLGLLLLAAAPARALQVRIESPDDNTVWATAKPTERLLRYKEKDQALVAVVTFRDDLHSGAGSNVQEDTLFFRFPGVHFDLQDQTLYVETENKAVIPIGEWRPGAFGHRQVLLYTNTVIAVSRNHGHVALALDVDTDRTPERIEKEKQAQDAGQAENFTLDGLIHAKP